jgi:hypothetical protein
VRGSIIIINIAVERLTGPLWRRNCPIHKGCTGAPITSKRRRLVNDPASPVPDVISFPNVYIIDNYWTDPETGRSFFFL